MLERSGTEPIQVTFPAEEHLDRDTAVDASVSADQPVQSSELASLSIGGVSFDPEGVFLRNVMFEAIRGDVQIEFLQPVSICFLDMDGRSHCVAMRMKMEYLLDKLGIDTGCDADSLIHDESGRFIKPLAGNLVLGVQGSVVIPDEELSKVRHLRDDEVHRRLSFSKSAGERRQVYDYAVVYPTNESARIFDGEWNGEQIGREGANIDRIQEVAQAGRLKTRIIDMKTVFTPSHQGDHEFGALFRLILADQMAAGTVRIQRTAARVA